MDESTKYLKAMLFIQLQSLPGTMTFSKPELLLQRAGFGHKEISELLGKKEAAVIKTIQRAKLAQKDDTE